MWWCLEVRPLGDGEVIQCSLINGISALMEGTPESSLNPPTMWGHRQMSVVYNWKSPLSRTWPCWYPDLRLPASRTVRNRCLVFTRHLCYDILLQQLEWTKIAFTHDSSPNSHLSHVLICRFLKDKVCVLTGIATPTLCLLHPSLYRDGTKQITILGKKQRMLWLTFF